ncbi:VOC family protein [Chitinophaga vietnamensis]|uniref:VOC family protein n=1 Tax=Chitinophaga vietnamensis TaxID=2593957 RepID=UPI00117768CB|nr:VOC family protein [Chitinophaga vietnamensis]
MTINHLNLPLADVPAATDIFTRCLGFRTIETKGNNDIVVLANEAGFTLVLMANRKATPMYPDNFHFGFFLDSTEAVDACFRQLQNSSVQADRAPGKIRNSYTFYCFLEPGVMMEVSYQYP